MLLLQQNVAADARSTVSIPVLVVLLVAGRLRVPSPTKQAPDGVAAS